MRLAKTFDVIGVEDLNVKGMLKNHSLAKHISDASWGEFVRQLEYETTWYGSTLVKAGCFYTSSPTRRSRISLDTSAQHSVWDVFTAPHHQQSLPKGVELFS
jgi:IS605 OrfB family transposase